MAEVCSLSRELPEAEREARKAYDEERLLRGVNGYERPGSRRRARKGKETEHLSRANDSLHAFVVLKGEEEKRLG